MISRNLKRVVSSVVLIAAVSVCTSVSAGELSRGQRWVRSHPFTTMALTIIPESCNPQQYKDANLTTTLAWKQREQLLEGSAGVGLPWHLHLRRVVLNKDGLTDQLKTRLKGHVRNYKGCSGWMVWDEPNRAEMFRAAETVKWLKKTWPETLVYSNAYPMGATPERYYGGKTPTGGYSYEQYLRDFSTILGSDVVMYDAYIFREGGGTGNPFPTMNTARKVALEHGKPYWSFVQSHADERRGYRMPSESDIRMQVFAHLASGFTGIGYFTYEDQQGPAMVSNSTRQRRPIYYHVSRLNQEVINVGRALRFLKSTDVRYVAGPGNRVPTAATAWQPGAGGNKLIRSISIKGATSKPIEWRDVLVGFFKDDQGGDYFMLTNLWHGEGMSSARRSMTVTLKLQPGVTTIGRLSRETGMAERLSVKGDELEVTLPGGTGELLRFESAEFPGLGQDD
ncbi:MAG: hypothetical protein VX669_00610 [Planctomycetota bacterium]|nr:hypothetical protein [Planctomycetota bacterium]